MLGISRRTRQFPGTKTSPILIRLDNSVFLVVLVGVLVVLVVFAALVVLVALIVFVAVAVAVIVVVAVVVGVAVADSSFPNEN